MLDSSIWPISRTGDNSPGHCEPGSNDNEGILLIPQRSSITGASPSDCLMSYLGHSLWGGSNSSADMQSLYSTAPSDWTSIVLYCIALYNNGIIKIPKEMKSSKTHVNDSQFLDYLMSDGLINDTYLMIKKFMGRSPVCRGSVPISKPGITKWVGWFNRCLFLIISLLFGLFDISLFSTILVFKRT